jgi:signal transduction histidine kinase
MTRPALDWRSLLTLLAVAVVTATIFYSRYLAGRIAVEERRKVEEWAGAQRYIAQSLPEQDILFASLLVAGQTTIPVIETDERDSITGHHNIDADGPAPDTIRLRRLLRAFAEAHPPIITYLDTGRTRFNRYYYGESSLLRQVRYYPIIQLAIAVLFIAVALLWSAARHRAERDRLWTALARETAHQLGTPLTALEGWMAMIRESPADTGIVDEMGRDLERLKRVSERFGRIGGPPRLEVCELATLVPQVVEYVRKRASSRVSMTVSAEAEDAYRVMASAPLLEWVFENLLRNALDALQGSGEVRVRMHREGDEVCIDVSDTGKGIPPADRGRIFLPGFTTKKSGWGLGLTLSLRIVRDYHGGRLSVFSSEPGRETTFRVVLKAAGV